MARPRGEDDVVISAMTKLDQNEPQAPIPVLGADIEILSLLMEDQRALNNNYDVRNGIFITINAALSAFCGQMMPDKNPYGFIIASITGILISVSWRQTLSMGKYFQYSREMDVADFLARKPELQAIFRSAARKPKPDIPRPEGAAVSVVMKRLSILFIGFWLALLAVGVANVRAGGFASHKARAPQVEGAGPVGKVTEKSKLGG